ncbi:MAG: SDR family NAD(P)-dependent oxidoreductase [Caulobacteraceae bacterium]|nr:SDR family NAD(P)-dependent oxidoreductase [Caulobacteraceae bacterium]
MTDRVVVVTGASGILGKAVCQAALASGHRVAEIDFSPAASEHEATGTMVLGGVDLTSPEQAAEAINSIIARFGQVDVLMNIAGGFRWETVGASDLALWERMHQMNLVTTLNASKAVLPHLLARRSGRIVNVGANGALKAMAGMGAYAASKSAVHRLTEALAEETKGAGVTVNAVLPSILDTPANRADMPDADFNLWVKPAALAEVMLFLAGPEAAVITGALLPVTGGV